MTQCNSLNVKLSSSQLNKIKSVIKNETEVVLRLSSSMIGNSDNETNFPHKLVSTNRQVANLRKAFADFLSVNNKLSKCQLSKMIQSGGFLRRLLGPLLKTGLPLMKNVIKTLAKIALVPLRLTAAALAADAEIHKKISAAGAITLIILNNEMGDIMKMVKSLEDSGLLSKSVIETIQNEAKEQKGGFLRMLLGTLGASLFGKMLTGKEFIRVGYGPVGFSIKDLQSKYFQFKKEKGNIRAGYGSLINDF